MKNRTNWGAGIPNIRRLAEDTKHHLASGGASAQALATNTVAILEEMERMLAAEAEAARHIAEANRRTERVADAMRRLIHAYGSERWSSATEHAMTLIGSMGAVPIARDESYRLAIEALRELMADRSWANMTYAKEVPGSGGGLRGKITLVWNGNSERHPRDLARVICRALFNLDPDRPDFENSVLGPEPQITETDERRLLGAGDGA